ncbi:Pentatricopeptide repeat-containing protein [Camellia lanceoleosa]|uniref:Pentatricopeptide repeat-containing protein n=1 Tax=Camellia lanceoleosa TaxID=1840588 RepID=A0ACC0GY44_9ERIC|nr:Pentatricopeptide repeat-containing protein [Camellia lanceoleosa]
MKSLAVCTTTHIVNMYRRNGVLPCALQDIIETVVDQCQQQNEDWFSQRKDCNDKRDLRAVFNVLDTMLKDSLERLKTMREGISWAHTGLCGRTFEGSYTQHVAIIRALCLEGRIDEACYIYSVMSRMGVAPDHISYKMLIQGLCIQGHVIEANEFLVSMLENSIVPEPLIWNSIIDGYGRSGDIQNALSIRDQMVAFGVLPNVFTYNALIHAHTKRGKIVEAHSLKKEMLVNGLSPDLVTYNLLLGAACDVGHIHSALQLHDEILRTGYDPDIITNFYEKLQAELMLVTLSCSPWFQKRRVVSAQREKATQVVVQPSRNILVAISDYIVASCPQLQPLPCLVFALLHNPLLRFHEEGVHPDYQIYLQCLFRLMFSCISFAYQIRASLVLYSIEKMIIRCLCLLLLILKLILLNLIRLSQLYMGLLRAKLQNR